MASGGIVLATAVTPIEFLSEKVARTPFPDVLANSGSLLFPFTHSGVSSCDEELPVLSPIHPCRQLINITTKHLCPKILYITKHKIKLTLQNHTLHTTSDRKPFAAAYIVERDAFTVEKEVVYISFSFFPPCVGRNFIFECRPIDGEKYFHISICLDA